MGIPEMLFEKVKSGDEDAFNELYLMNYDRVIGAIHRYIEEPDIVEHIANGVFATVWQVRNSASGFKGKSSFATWVTRIAFNASLMYLRSIKTEGRYISLEECEAPQIAVRDLDLEGVLDRKELAYAIEHLIPKLKIVVVLRLVEGMTTEETCEILHLDVAVVKSRLYRGRMLMREYLSRR